VSGHSLKLHFFLFEKSQGKHNNLDCQKKLEYFPLIAKFTCSKFYTTQKKKLHVQNTQTLKMNNPFFF